MWLLQIIGLIRISDSSGAARPAPHRPYWNFFGHGKFERSAGRRSPVPAADSSMNHVR
jgi:hypothetical protein